MILKKKFIPFSCLIITLVLSVMPAGYAAENNSLLAVGPATEAYAKNTVEPELASLDPNDRLAVFLKISEVLTDPQIGIGINQVDPQAFMIFHMLSKYRLGFLYLLKYGAQQRTLIRNWHQKYMQDNPANVFFAQSAEEIIRTKAAFGCSHYARSFIAVVKALELVENPSDIRYVVSSKADDYNRALTTHDGKMTINGHQFVLLKQNETWIALNTSKAEYTVMPEGFSPESCRPPRNIPVKFASYPDVVFLLRKISPDYNNDGHDNSLKALMNISRSGDEKNPEFLWDEFVF